ncbi:MAG TPA: efflux RND transporter periplasmic adaptor subunit [Flavobacteriales bacterium]|nr:efflux RND transporter periplasmic adaptor subunit [Flavobacteriales bacterium]
MKNILLPLTIAALLVACGAAAPEGEIGQKKAELETLKTSYKELALKIKDLETWIAANDSNAVRNLPVVTAQALSVGPFTHYVDVHGTVRADQAAALYSGGGRVRRILVSPGDRVRTGQLIISIDNDLAAEQIQQAEAAYELARTAFEKQQSLWNQKIGSEMQFLQAKSQKEQAEAGLAAVREQQRLTNITAPFDGTVDDIMVRVGDMTSPMQPAARVVNLSGVQLEADVPEGYLRTVRSGAPVKVHFPSIGDTLTAELAHVGQFIDPSNRTFKVSVRVPNGEQMMRPNLLSDISIQDFHTDSALVLPSRAVLQDVNGNNYIYVLDRGTGDEAKARKVLVHRVSEYKGRLSVTPVEPGGLKGGEMIVDEGAKNVSDGLAVRIANN